MSVVDPPGALEGVQVDAAQRAGDPASGEGDRRPRGRQALVARMRAIVAAVAADRSHVFADVSSGDRASAGRSAGMFVGGLMTNLLATATAFRRCGTEEWGLRAATRSTGQSGLIFYLPFFAGRALHQLRPSPLSRWLARHRESFLRAYFGGHVVHVPLIVTLMRRHGHPQRGTYMYYLSVYGGSVGYAGLLTLLALCSPARMQRNDDVRRHLAALAEWYIIIGPHGVPTVDAYRFKNPPLALYAVPVALWGTAVGLRAAGMLQAAGMLAPNGSAAATADERASDGV